MKTLHIFKFSSWETLSQHLYFSTPIISVITSTLEALCQLILYFNPGLTSVMSQMKMFKTVYCLSPGTFKPKGPQKNSCYPYHRSLLLKSRCCNPKSRPLLKLLTHPYHASLVLIAALYRENINLSVPHFWCFHAPSSNIRFCLVTSKSSKHR